MRIDLAETGNKDIDIEFNGKPLDAVLWADEEAGECEVFEKHHMTGDLVKDPGTKWGYRSTVLKGKVKIIDRRPKTESRGDTVYDFQYPGMCCLKVNSAHFDTEPSVITVLDAVTGITVKTFSMMVSISRLCEAVLALYDRANVREVYVDVRGIGSVVYDNLRVTLNCPLYRA